MKKLLSLSALPTLRPLLSSVILFGLAASSTADTLSISIGANVWQQALSGGVQDGSSLIDVEDDLGMDDETNNVFYATFEHPIPLLPNLKLQHTEISQSANNTLLNNIDFDGIDYDGNIQSDIDLSHTDATFYYEVLDNWISLDLGLTVRLFDGEVSISSSVDSSSEDLEGPLPLLYGKIQFDLPLTGLSASITVNGISYDGDSLIDAAVSIAYQLKMGLGIEAGYRQLSVDIEDDDLQADIDLGGAFAGLTFKF